MLNIKTAREVIAVNTIITIPKQSTHIYPHLRQCRKLDIEGNISYYHKETFTLIIII
jgi:hypothetical protein